MSADVVISYDGTESDDDALALGSLLVQDPGRLVLAYVRHAPEDDPEREAAAQSDAERRLQLGAERLGNADIRQDIVFSGSTGGGLEQLVREEGAMIVVFGSDYRTPPGHAEPPTSAQRLLEIGAAGIAVAASGLHEEPQAAIATVTVVSDPGDDTAARTAEALAAVSGAEILPDGLDADVIVVGSQPDAPPGRVALSGAARTALDASLGSVLIVPSGRPIGF